MQQSIEERQSPKRRTKSRRHPRSQVLGFSPRQWPFIFVLIGNWLFAGLFFAICKLLWHWVPTD